MVAIVILNVVLSLAVIVGILGLLAWGIYSNEMHAARLAIHARRHARERAPRAHRARGGRTVTA